MKPIHRAGTAVFCVLVGLTGTASAEPTPEEISAARTLGSDGLKLADAGDCKAAIEKLDKASKLFPAQTIMEKLGECLVKQGKLVAGAEALRRAATDSLPTGASQAMVKAQRSAQEQLTAVQGRIGRLKFGIKAPAGSDVRVSVDGEPVSKVLVETERPTDPGEHDIEASGTGFLPVKVHVSVPEGQLASVQLELVPDPALAKKAAPPPPAVSAAPPPPPPPPVEEKSKVPAIVAFGVGGVGIAVGAIFGLSASSKKSSLDNSCVDKHCPASSQSDIDSMKSAATISTVGFILGAAGVGVGTYLLLSGGSSAPAQSGKVKAQPYVGLGSAGVAGSF